MDSSVELDGSAVKKRRMEDDDDGGGGGGGGEIDGDIVSSMKKKVRKNGEEEMKRVAEIVLVLSAMGRMRGGRDPTVAEKAMMAEARAKVVAMCEELAPKDILPREAFGVVIDELGLNRLKEQRLGFRPPKLSISDKMALSQRKLEDSKAFAAQQASYPSQRLQTGTGAAGENRGTPPNFRMLSSEKAGHLPVSAGSSQTPTPVVHVSSATSTPSPFHPPSHEVRLPSVSSALQNNVGRDSPSTVPSRLDRAHIKPGIRQDGPSLHVSASSSADQHVVKTTSVHLQSQPAPWGNIGAKNKAPDHLPARNANLSSPQMTAVGQTLKPAVSQTALGTPPSIPHPVQSMHFVHAPPVYNHHLEISKIVQKLLEPKLPERPAFTLPSRDYMSRALACQFCKLVINEVENMLVCDACEKGYHLGCLQSYNAKGVPRGEWHCPRCLSMSHGKPFPPKYGRVTRNMNAPKISSNTAGVELSSEKRLETVDKKVTQPNAMTNGTPDFKTHTQGAKVDEFSSELNVSHGNEINENDMPTEIKKDDRPNSEQCDNDKPPHQVVKSEVCPSEDTMVSETDARTPVTPRETNTSNQMPTSSNQNDVDQNGGSNGVEIPVLPHSETNGVVECNKDYDDKRPEKDVVQENLLETERIHGHGQEIAEASENGLHNVDWIGNSDRVVDEKKFYQSCCVNGVVYEVHDYALYCSGNGKLTPMKLQAMWEDVRTSSKWLIVHKCYFPDELPEEVGRPGAPQSNEVYESTHERNVVAGFIQGPCEVLPFRKFGEESERSSEGSQANDRTGPVFIRNWFYDESRRAFCPNAS